jgi:hypothetical protein
MKPMKNDPDRAKPLLSKAQQAQQMSDDLYNSIEKLKRT